jgi:hypothetical protein
VNAMRPRLLLPIGLTVMGVALLTGCIYIPQFDRVIKGNDASRAVGDPKSKKPLVTGNATIHAVLEKLGAPAFVDPSRRRLGYRWRTLSSVTVWPLCAWVSPDESASTLVLQFDASDTLFGFYVEKVWAGNDVSMGRFEPEPPDGMISFSVGVWPATAPATTTAAQQP